MRVVRNKSHKNNMFLGLVLTLALGYGVYLLTELDEDE